MNNRQARALELMRAPNKERGYHERELYTLADADGGDSGVYRLTYAAGCDYESLTKDDISDLLRDGLVYKKHPGCYRLTPKGGSAA